MSGEPIGFRPGTVVGGKFRIERVIAEGGMGLVVAATHLDLDQLVALKFFRAEVGADRRSLLERFTREAKAAARLKSEHVARVFDVSVTDDGRPYMVIEYLEGQSLDRLLDENGPLDVARAVEYAAQACEGLAEAHARGIVHRDIKPSNLFLVSRPPGPGIIKILDFGISKLALSDASNFATNIMMGTPCYMSPEQIRSTATVDHRADIWSLGATLYQLLAGKAPFDASRDLLALAESIVFDSPQPLDQLRPDIPKQLAGVVARCLSKDRNARYSSTGELAVALLPFAGPRASGPVERAASMSPAVIQVSSGSAPQVREVRRDVPAPVLPPTLRRVRPTANGGVPRGMLIASAVAAVVCIATWTISTLLAGRVAAPTVAVQAKPAATETRGEAHAAGASAASTPSTAPGPAHAPAPVPARATSAVVAPATVPEVNALLVRASPSFAQIFVDGAPVSGNPYRGRYARNGGAHQVEAMARGYQPMRKRFSLDGDLVVDLTLARSEGAGGAGRRSRSKGDNPPARSTAVLTEPGAPPLHRQEVDPAGGREPLRPIEVRNPYGTQ
jgi:eukaryotic-like serine/threonine-protein kinase